MNARTSRLLRRLAAVVHVAEYRANAARPEQQRQRVPTEAMQLAHLKLAWNRTPRPKRGAQRVRCVDIFHAITGAPRA